MKQLSRQIFVWIIFVFCFSNCNFINAENFVSANIKNEFSNEIVANKFYVDKSLIQISENQLYISINHQPHPISLISCDENGIFVLLENYKPKNSRDWLCEDNHCWQWNHYQRFSCWNCGTDKPKNPTYWGE